MQKIICNVLNALLDVKFAQMKLNVLNANRLLFWKRNHVSLNALLHITYKVQSVINAQKIAQFVILKLYVQIVLMVNSLNNHNV